MERSGMFHSLRVGGLLTAVAIGTAACGSSAKTTTAATTPKPATSATPTSAPPTTLPDGCHVGVADSVDSTLAILTDKAMCSGSVNAYWKSQLGDAWTPPTFVPYDDGQIPNNECGRADGNADDFADNAFYCPADDTVAYSRDLLNSLYAQGGPYLPVVVLMHELGHRADHIAHDVGPISRSEENQADCDAGVTTAFARTAHRLPFTDVIKAATLLYKLGDTRHFGSELASAPDAHGTPAERAIAFSRGYFQKIGACHMIGQSESGSAT